MKPTKPSNLARLATIAIGALAMAGALSAHSRPATSPRSVDRFDAGWRFFYGDAPGADNPDFNDANWRCVDLPHDFSIEDLPALDASTHPSLPVTQGDWNSNS